MGRKMGIMNNVPEEHFVKPKYQMNWAQCVLEILDIILQFSKKSLFFGLCLMN